MIWKAALKKLQFVIFAIERAVYSFEISFLFINKRSLHLLNRALGDRETHQFKAWFDRINPIKHFNPTIAGYVSVYLIYQYP